MGLPFARLFYILALAAAVSGCAANHPSLPPGISSSVSNANNDANADGRANSAAAVLVTATPAMADSFVDSIGVNLHLGDFSSWYGKNFNGILFLMDSLGARHYRDGGNLGYASILSQYHQLSAVGAKLDMESTIGDSMTSLIAWGKEIGPSTLESIEGPNEYDLSGLSDWATLLNAFQSELYPSIKSFADIPVISPALTTQSALTALAALHPLADEGNMHDYFGGRNPGTGGWGSTDSFGTYGSLPWNIALSDQPTEGKPLVSTETGYSDADDPHPLPADIKARYTVRTLLEHWNADVKRTYLYELIDQGPTPFSHYGLADSNGNAKPAFRAIKRMITHLKDPGGAFTVTPLTYSLAGNVHHTLLQRRDGAYVLIVWVEAYEWNVDTSERIAVASQNVSLGFAKAPHAMSATTFGPTGEITTSTLATGTTVSLKATGYPTMIDITP